VTGIPRWNEIPKDWNPDASPQEAQAMGHEFDEQYQENGGKPPEFPEPEDG
jgi:hypothetical protein